MRIKNDLEGLEGENLQSFITTVSNLMPLLTNYKVTDVIISKYDNINAEYVSMSIRLKMEK